MSEIWVISETTSSILELIAHAKNFSQGEEIIAWSFTVEGAEQAAIHGADKVFQFQVMNRPEACVNVLVEKAKIHQPTAILLGSTKRSKEIAARIAAALDTALSTECIRIVKEDGISAERYIFGGLCIAKETSQSSPFMATMAPKTVEILQESPAVDTELISGAEDSCRVIELRKNQGTVNLSDADVVVCIGRGIAKQEDIEMVNRLAKALRGKVGCTRPIAEDLHWMSEESYIGISGQAVKPKLYIGLGVSGQIQHVAGIRDSKTIIAIDKNENAPIVEAADYALIGDVYEILPALLQKLNV